MNEKQVYSKGLLTWGPVFLILPCARRRDAKKKHLSSLSGGRVTEAKMLRHVAPVPCSLS